MKKALLLACVALACASCGGGKQKKGAETEAAGGEGALKEVYSMPRIPAMIADPVGQAEWAAAHFWDGFDFADTLGVERWNDYAQQAFVDYTQLLFNIPREMGEGSIAILFRKAAADKTVFLGFADIAEKYLFDPNSPYRDEEYYIATLNAVLANPALDQWERIRPQEQLRMALKNRVGERATDFRYTLASGATGTLRGIRAPYTLLFFYNPDCPTCRQVREQITASPYLSRLVQEDTLAVLAVHPDADLKLWREYLPNIPAKWINAHNSELRGGVDEPYDLKAIPTLYLLDEDKRVMLKDVMSIPLIEDTINNDLKRE